MLIIGPELRDILLADTDIASLVDTRIYPVSRVTDNNLPAVGYTLISQQIEETHGGPAGLSRKSIQLDCFGRTHTEAHTLADYVRWALDGYRSDPDSDGLRLIQAILVENILETHEQDPDPRDTGVYRVIVEIAVWHWEGAP